MIRALSLCSEQSSGDRSGGSTPRSNISVASPLLSPTRVSSNIDRRLSVTVPRLSVDHHILNLYRIYQNGLGLDSS